jgi:hypothetical protein
MPKLKILTNIEAKDSPYWAIVAHRRRTAQVNPLYYGDNRAAFRESVAREASIYLV